MQGSHCTEGNLEGSKARIGEGEDHEACVIVMILVVLAVVVVAIAVGTTTTYLFFTVTVYDSNKGRITPFVVASRSF